MPVYWEEALRYLGAADAPEPLRRQAEDIWNHLTEDIRPNFVFRVFDLDFSPEGVRFAGTDVLLPGTTAAGMLKQCRRAALLACTLGSRFDLALLAMQARDMARAAIYDACGSAYVENGCDEAEKALSVRLPGLFLTDRFSPGYGDLPLDVQGPLCAALDAQRRLGLTVTESALLNPVKSVTAVVGIAETPQPARIRGCAYCQMRETCLLRKGGNHCGN